MLESRSIGWSSASPRNPSRNPISASRGTPMAALPNPRIAALSPGLSPPAVRMPTRLVRAMARVSATAGRRGSRPWHHPCMDATRFRDALATGRPIVLDGGLATRARGAGRGPLGRAVVRPAPRRRPGRGSRPPTSRSTGPARGSRPPRATRRRSRGSPRAGSGTTTPTALLRRSVELAERGPRRAPSPRASPGPLFVAASVGPYGAMLADGSEYRGRYGRTVGVARATSTASASPCSPATDADVLAIETIPELEEAAALAGLLADLAGRRGLGRASAARTAPASGAARPIEEAVAAVAGAPGRRRRRRQLHRPRARPGARRPDPGDRPRCPSSPTPTAARAGTPSRGVGRAAPPGGSTRRRPPALARGRRDRSSAAAAASARARWRPWRRAGGVAVSGGPRLRA